MQMIWVGHAQRADGVAVVVRDPVETRAARRSIAFFTGYFTVCQAIIITSSRSPHVRRVCRTTVCTVVQ